MVSHSAIARADQPLLPHGAPRRPTGTSRSGNANSRHHLARRIDIVEIDIVGTPKRKWRTRRTMTSRPAVEKVWRSFGMVRNVVTKPGVALTHPRKIVAGLERLNDS